MTALAPTVRVPGPRTGTRGPELTTADRVAIGKAARKAVPRSSHAQWRSPEGRADPIDVLERQGQSRLAELLPIRHGRMAASAFAFYRGAAAVMAADLDRTPVSGLQVQLCGDAHLANFGAFASPERRLVFDLNDFDETLPGPWEWDLKRLVASFDLAARERGLPDVERRDLVETSARAYREAMASFAEMTTMGVWYVHLDVDAVVARWRAEVDQKTLKALARSVSKAHQRDSVRAVGKLTTRVDGRLRFVSDPPLLVPLSEVAGIEDPEVIDRALRAILRSYRRSLPTERQHLLDGYRVVDAARKVVGVGSVGTRCWVVLLTGRDDSDVLVLQVKEAPASALQPYLPRNRFQNEGRRVVEGQRLMQATGDVLLGWDRINGLDGQDRDFYVRQMWDWKGAADVSVMRPRGLRIYAQMCGWTLARGHARSGDPVAIAAYLGTSATMDRALVDFADSYATQAEADHTLLLEAVAAGRLSAVDGI